MFPLTAECASPFLFYFSNAIGKLKYVITNNSEYFVRQNKCCLFLLLTFCACHVSELWRLFMFASHSEYSMLMLCAGVTYSQRHSVDVATYAAIQGSASSMGACGGPAFSVVNGDSSQQGSGNTTPLAFDYDTRSYMSNIVITVMPCPTSCASLSTASWQSSCLSICPAL